MWNTLLKSEEHEHGADDPPDLERCPNCRVEALVGRLTEFEMFCWNWYQSDYNAFARETGAAVMLIQALELPKSVLRLFFRGVGKVHDTMKRIEAEIREKAKQGAE